MIATVFTVAEVFDLEGRDGLLLAGDLEGGHVAAGNVLYDAETGMPVHVLGIEFHGSVEPGRATLVVNRHDASHLSQGSRLTDTPGE